MQDSPDFRKKVFQKVAGLSKMTDRPINIKELSKIKNDVILFRPEELSLLEISKNDIMYNEYKIKKKLSRINIDNPKVYVDNESEKSGRECYDDLLFGINEIFEDSITNSRIITREMLQERFIGPFIECTIFELKDRNSIKVEYSGEDNSEWVQKSLPVRADLSNLVFDLDVFNRNYAWSIMRDVMVNLNKKDYSFVLKGQNSPIVCYHLNLNEKFEQVQ